MRYLNTYNEGLFSGKKIDTNFLNRLESELESNADITDFNLSPHTPTSNTTIDATKVTFKYKGKPQEIYLLLKIEDSDTKIGSIVKKTFSKPYLLIRSIGWNIEYKDYANRVDDCVRDIINQVDWFQRGENAREEFQKEKKEKSNSFKETLPEETLRDLILNLEDILGSSNIKYSEHYLTWEVTFEKNSILKTNENTRISGNYYDAGGAQRGLVMNLASDKLFEIMNELAQLNSSIESFDCKMEFSIENRLKLVISQIKK